MRILTSGLSWMGAEFGSIQTAVEQSLESAQHEVLLVTYTLSTAADTAIAGIEDALKRGVSARIVLNRFDDHHPAVRRRLATMLADYARLRLFDFADPNDADLHAKFLAVDRRCAIVGSANVTWRGMVANHELAVFIDDPRLVDSVIAATDRMLKSPSVRELQ